MADAKKTVELVFEGVDKTSAATQAALKNVDKFASNVQSATQPLADFTVGALKLEAGLLLAGAAVTGFAIKVAGDFQTAATDLQKVLSDTDDIEAYTDLAIEMSERYGVASVDVLNSIANYKQAGFSAKEAGELTKSGLDLIIAGNVEAAASGELLVQSIKGFGAQASDAAGFVDLLNEVQNNYNASVPELIEGFAKLSPVARAAGFSLQETIAVLTPGIEVFKSGVEVANGLKTSFINLTAGTTNVAEGLGILNVRQTDANGQLRSARDIYFDVAGALGDVDENQKLYVAGLLAGKNHAAKFLATTNGVSDSLYIAGDAFDFVGSAAKEVALALDTAEVAAARSKVTFTNLFIGIGTPLLDEFTGIADAITAIFQAIGQSAETSGISEVIAFIEGEMAGLQETLETVAKNLPEALELADFSGFINGVTAISDSLSVLLDGIDLTTVEGLAKAIGLAGDAFEGLSEFTAGAIESFGPLFSILGDVVTELQKIDTETIKAFGGIGGAATQVNLLAGAVGGIISPMNALLAVIGVNQAAGLLGSMKSMGGLASGLIPLLGKAGIAGAAGAAGFAVGSLANNITETVTGTSISTWAIDVAIKLGLIEDEATSLAAALNDLPLEKVGQSAEESARAIAAADQAMTDMGRSTEDATNMVYNFSTGLFEIDDSVGTLHDLSAATSAAADELDKASGSVDKFSASADDITLDEKLAIIEAQSIIAAAALGAEAEKTVAAFESISAAITSTGDSLGTLFGLFEGADISEQLDLSRQIDIENERRDAALKLQERLTNAQIAELRARARSLEAGGALLTVNGDGLQPHLEAIMFELLEAIQIRVNAEGYGLLLGA